MALLLEANALVKDYRLPRGVREILRAPFGVKRRRALDGLTLSLSAGERVAVIGANGAGKSTLARIFCGVVLPDGGTARIEGIDTGFASPARKWVGFARPDDPALHGRLTAIEALRFHAALHGVSTAGIEALLEQVTASPVARQRLQTLSSGEKAKVSLAKALLPNPKVLLLDEISRVLDPGAARLARELLTAFAAKGGAVLLITHDLVEAALCDRVVVVDAGKVVADGAWSAVEAKAKEVFRL